MMRTKRHKFTLVEVLIAIFLVTGACFFLLNFEESYIKSARKSLKKVQKERLIQEAYVVLLEQLYTNQVPWKVVEDGGTHNFGLSEENWTVEACFKPVFHDVTEQLSQSLMDVKTELTLFHVGKKEAELPMIRLCLKKEERTHVQPNEKT